MWRLERACIAMVSSVDGCVAATRKHTRRRVLLRAATGAAQRVSP